MHLPVSFHSGKLSLFQSAVNKVVQGKGEATTMLSESHPMMQQANTVLQVIEKGENPNQFLGTPLQCASLAAQAALAFAAGDMAKEAALRAQMQDSTCDVAGWASCLTAYEAYFACGRAPSYTRWKNLNDFIYPIPEKGRSGKALTVAVLGDWGTGDPAVANSSLNAVFALQPDLIIHLGDIYYAGTPEECASNFLKYLADACKKNYRVPIYNLPGNHDYYSGGTGYYGLLPKLNPQCGPPGTPVQGASFFCLRSAGWQLQGMDTGYYDHDVFTVGNDYTDLSDSEVTWHLDKIKTAGERKIIFFSHHQLYSAFINIGTKANNYYNPNLLNYFKEPMNNGDITAWFWGHEHLLELYGPFPLLDANKQPKGRCVGHSAFPMLTSAKPYNAVYPASNVPLLGTPPFLGTTQDVYNHGFLILTLSEIDAQADYYQIPGDGSAAPHPLHPQYSETLWVAHTAAARG